MKINKSNILKKADIYMILSFLIPFLIIIAAFAKIGVFPFGSKSVLIYDGNGQYIDFFSAYRSVIKSGGNFFYSWSKGLGGNMMGVFSYYLASPLNIVFLIFPKKYILEAVFFLTALKIGLSGITFYNYSTRSKMVKSNKIIALIFSVGYALISYNIVYSLSLMWLDGVILLPILILLVERVILKKTYTAYGIILFLTVFSNYYIGYMISIFISVYYFCFYLYTYGYKNKKMFLCTTIRFALVSIISVAMTAIITLPTYYDLQNGKAQTTFEFMKQFSKFNYSFFDLFSKYFVGSYQSITDGLPHIFSGMIVALLVPIFFFNKKFSIREKAMYIVMLLFVYVSLDSYVLNRIMHCFQEPVAFPYRYSFIFSFLLLVISEKSISALKGIETKSIVKVYIFEIMIIILVQKFGYDYLSNNSIILTYIFLTLYMALLYMIKNSLRRKYLIMLVLIVTFEMFLNSIMLLKQQDNQLSYSDRKSYTDFVNTNQPKIDKIKTSDKEFYRIEKNFSRSFNDPLTLGYNGISTYTSSFDRDTIEFLKKIGFLQFHYWVSYSGATVLSDSLLDIKYILSNSGKVNQYYKASGEININSEALPLGVMVNSNIEKTNSDNDNPFIIQNSIVNNMINENADCFTKIETKDVKLTNVSASQAGDCTRYAKIDPNKDGYIQFDIKAPDKDEIYAYFSSSIDTPVALYLNNKTFGTYFDPLHNNILDLGSYNKNKDVSLQLKLTSNDTYIKDSMIYSFNNEKYKKIYSNLASNPLKISYYNSTCVKGTVNSNKDRDVLYTSIPYDDGWTVRIDGKKVSKVKLLDAFIGVKIPRGKHDIEFSYMPRGFILGAIISLICAAMLLSNAIYELKCKK